jgi:hypothetical protein
MIFEDGGEYVCNKVDAFLNRPSSHKHEQVGVWINGEIRPLLSLLPQVSACGFEGEIDSDDLLCLCGFIPGFGVARIRVRQLPNMLQSPKDRVACVRAGAVFVRNTDCTESPLVNSQVAGPCMKEVKNPVRFVNTRTKCSTS